MRIGAGRKVRLAHSHPDSDVQAEAACWARDEGRAHVRFAEAELIISSRWPSVRELMAKHASHLRKVALTTRDVEIVRVCPQCLQEKSVTLMASSSAAPQDSARLAFGFALVR